MKLHGIHRGGAHASHGNPNITSSVYLDFLGKKRAAHQWDLQTSESTKRLWITAFYISVFHEAFHCTLEPRNPDKSAFVGRQHWLCTPQGFWMLFSCEMWQVLCIVLNRFSEFLWQLAKEEHRYDYTMMTNDATRLTTITERDDVGVCTTGCILGVFLGTCVLRTRWLS